MSHTTAETLQTFRCAGCEEKDAEISRLTAALENWEKDFILYRKMLWDKTSQILALKSATRRVVEALDRCESNRGRFSCAPLHDCRCEKDRGISGECTCGNDELVDALADPIIVSLRKEG